MKKELEIMIPAVFLGCSIKKAVFYVHGQEDGRRSGSIPQMWAWLFWLVVLSVDLPKHGERVNGQ